MERGFDNKIVYGHLDEALAEIKDNDGKRFRLEVLKDYLNNEKKYEDWFDLTLFILGFKEEDKDALPFLRELIKSDSLSKSEKDEIESAISAIGDPEKYNKEIEEAAKKLTENLDEFKDFSNLLEGKKKIDREDFLERASESDEEFETNFKCNNCGKRQNLKTGLIHEVGDNNFVFENEIMCKNCFSNNINLSEVGKEELLGKKIRMLIGHEKGFLPSGKYVSVEDKKMPYNKIYNYILKRLDEEPNNAEIYLRAANVARKKNLYGEAIKFFEKSIELNENLIASYINLVEIYFYRYDYYKKINDKEKALNYFKQLINLFNKHFYDKATIRSDEYILDFMKDYSNKLGLILDIRQTKIGRNAPCPCGSGKKYKRCCLWKELE